MKQKKILWLSCILSFSALFSCSKAIDNSPAPVNNKFSSKLLKVYQIDTTKQVPNDTINKWFFAYDNLNRIISDSFVAMYQSSIYTRIRTTQYNGNDTFALSSVTRSPASIDTSYYTFNNGNYVKDTVIYHSSMGASNATSRNTFIYQPGVIIRSFQNWVPQWSYSSTEQQTIHQNIRDGNIVYQIDTLLSFTNGKSSSDPQTYETTVSYLPNPNPFFNTVKAIRKRYFDVQGIGNYSYQYAPEHLIEKQTSRWGIGPTLYNSIVNYNYIFRTDGYPLTAIMTLETDGGKKTMTKLLFVYAQD